MTTPHQRFLGKYCLPDRHYSFEQAPLGYLQHAKLSHDVLRSVISDNDLQHAYIARNNPSIDEQSKELLNKKLVHVDAIGKLSKAYRKHEQISHLIQNASNLNHVAVVNSGNKYHVIALSTVDGAYEYGLGTTEFHSLEHAIDYSHHFAKYVKATDANPIDPDFEANLDQASNDLTAAYNRLTKQ